MTSRRAGGALVTGGTGAVGSAVCRLLAAAGFDIAFGYRSNEGARERLTGDLKSMGRQAFSAPVDLSVPVDADRFVDDAAARLDGIDVLVHAGGPYVPQRFISQISPEQFGAHVDDEVKAFFNLLSPALPHLRRSKGVLVAVTTVAVRRFPLRDALSSGPKAGIEALVRAVAAEEGRFGIRANCVGPGILQDGMAADLHARGDFTEAARDRVLKSIPLRRFGTADDVAALVCFLTSHKAGYISGQCIDVDGGYAL